MEKKRKSRSFKSKYTKHFYLCHWVSGALSLSTMLLFAFTGITLNNAKKISGNQTVEERELTLSAELLKSIEMPSAESVSVDEQALENKPLPVRVCKELSKVLGVSLQGVKAEWSEYEINYLNEKPGKSEWLTVDRESGEVVYQKTDRGFISMLNDLHQGRNAGTVWSWFMDIFSVACIVFTITGIALMWVHAKRRPSTWPIGFASLLIPLLVILFFVH